MKRRFEIITVVGKYGWCEIPETGRLQCRFLRIAQSDLTILFLYLRPRIGMVSEDVRYRIEYTSRTVPELSIFAGEIATEP